MIIKLIKRNYQNILSQNFKREDSNKLVGTRLYNKSLGYNKLKQIEVKLNKYK